jgi:hypothetical protein
MEYGHASCAVAKGRRSHCSNKFSFLFFGLSLPFFSCFFHHLAFELHCFQLHVTSTMIKKIKNVYNSVVP